MLTRGEVVVRGQAAGRLMVGAALGAIEKSVRNGSCEIRYVENDPR